MIELGYHSGVPMGGDLPANSTGSSAPTFILAARRDTAATSAPLQQLQIIKGWIDGTGTSHTKVTSVAGTPNNQAGFNTTDGEIFGEGHGTLCAVYDDPDFDPAEPAYYYMRAVENPSPRWSFFDCLAMDPSERPEVCSDESHWTIQEMAWSSPIWYTPPKSR